MNLENLNQQKIRQVLLASLDKQGQQQFQGYPYQREDSLQGSNSDEEGKEDYEKYLHQVQMSEEDEENAMNIITSPQMSNQKYKHLWDKSEVSRKQSTEVEQAISDIQRKRAYILVFGRNGDGELGVGSQKDVFAPKAIAPVLKNGQVAKSISSGSHHSAVVSKAGDLYVCGSQLHGKLGISNLNVMNLHKFQMVPLPGKVKQVACGDYHTLCLLDSGQVYAWGGTLYKKVGEKSNQTQNHDPRIVTGLIEKTITQIDCGDFHSVALDSENKIYSWGGGGSAYNKGQCGHGHNEDIESPQLVQQLSHKIVTKVAAGGYHTLALCQDNELYAWGSGTYGECGYGDFQETNKPRQVKMPNEYLNNNELNQIEDEFEFLQQKPEITKISAGGHHSLILTAKGRVYSFGYGSHGQLGLRTTKNFATPQLVKDLLSKPIAAVAAGWNHSLVLSAKGDLFACGYGNHGQLGLNDKESRTHFTHVADLGPKNIFKMFAGGNHSWVVLDDIMPARENYRPPSPVGHIATTNLTSPVQISPRQSSVKSNLVTKNGFNQQIVNRRKFELGIHVTYTDTSMCHRFITFETKKELKEDQKVKESIDDFVRGLYRDEQGAVLYHKIQEGLDDQGSAKAGPLQAPDNSIEEKFYTVCIVFDPERSAQVKPQIQKLNASSKQLPKDKVVYYQESEITASPLESKLAGWAFDFSSKIGDKHCIRRPRFSELRPAYLKSL